MEDESEKKERNLTPLPRNLLEAMEILGQSELAKTVMGTDDLSRKVQFKPSAAGESKKKLFTMEILSFGS